MLGENQFLIKYVDKNSLFHAFGMDPIGDSVDVKLFNNLKIYDNNVYLYSLAEKEFDKAYSKLIEEKDFNLSYLINTSFYLNVCLRMINTLDDILLKIMVYTHLHFNKTQDNILDVGDKKYINYYDYVISNDVVNYPPRATRTNRKTRLIRNEITHHGEPLLISNPIREENDIYVDVSNEGLRERNINLYNSIIDDMNDDIEEINRVRNEIEKIILQDNLYQKKHQYL